MLIERCTAEPEDASVPPVRSEKSLGDFIPASPAHYDVGR